MKTLDINGIKCGNHLPFVLIGGMNVIEEESLTLKVAETFKQECDALNIPFIFKASYDKANRTAVDSYRGPGLDEGLRILEKIKKSLDVLILTDVHWPQDCAAVAEVADVLQLPAFLSRQTDLIQAMAQTQKAINIKKPQFMPPLQISHVFEKFRSFGNPRVMMCERGTQFGYEDLIVDILGFRLMKEATLHAPVIFDVTHALQCRKGFAAASGGRRRQLPELARAAMATGLAGLFLEAHPDPDRAMCDGPSALPLQLLKPFLQQIKLTDELVKSFEEIRID
jgi:2-dehydro-3-deoxyphosphooctonate aldolase (KDO 8-P synthase)